MDEQLMNRAKELAKRLSSHKHGSPQLRVSPPPVVGVPHIDLLVRADSNVEWAVECGPAMKANDAEDGLVLLIYTAMKAGIESAGLFPPGEYERRVA